VVALPLPAVTTTRDPFAVSALTACEWRGGRSALSGRMAGGRQFLRGRFAPLLPLPYAPVWSGPYGDGVTSFDGVPERVRTLSLMTIDLLVVAVAGWFTASDAAWNDPGGDRIAHRDDACPRDDLAREVESNMWGRNTVMD